MEHKDHLDNLAHVRSLMENSSKFISLSGLSGVAAGTWALIGAAIIYFASDFRLAGYHEVSQRWLPIQFLHLEIIVAISILVLALLTGYFFTARKARKTGEKVWTKAAVKMTINLFIPLFTGGAFCLVLMYRGYWELLGPSTLIFYGLGLINGGKYTLSDIRKLGFLEIILGLICLLWVNYTLLFWAIGFGVLHILYGLRMYFKYDR